MVAAPPHNNGMRLTADTVVVVLGRGGRKLKHNPLAPPPSGVELISTPEGGGAKGLIQSAIGLLFARRVAAGAAAARAVVAVV